MKLKNRSLNLFENRSVVIATKHGKEQVISPLLSREMGLVPRLATDFDSDKFGTFTGEIERELDPLQTAIEKCKSAMNQSGCDLGVASEGSFGNHPSIWFAKANDELVVLVDEKNDIILHGRNLTTNTNFDGKAVSSGVDAEEFAMSVGFPSHRLIARVCKDGEVIAKGISSSKMLNSIVQEHCKGQGVYLETDMRAMNNPTRMKSIQAATENLIANILSICPCCGWPGFIVTQSNRGLPCELCSYPTRSILNHVKECSRCSHSEVLKFPNGKNKEDPMYCDSCNP